MIDPKRYTKIGAIRKKMKKSNAIGCRDSWSLWLQVLSCIFSAAGIEPDICGGPAELSAEAFAL